ncbi:MAG: hypothetical protein AAFQ36_04610 [Pseudomonadota bacterium]
MRPDPPSARQQTALDQYARLEAVGTLTIEGGETREVIVSFGTARLTMASIEGEFVAQWSIAALVEEPVEGGVRYAPDGANDDALVIRDPEMIQAIALVKSPEPVRKYRKTRLSLLIGAGLLAVALGVLAFLPRPLASHLARSLSEAHWARLALIMEPRFLGALEGSRCVPPSALELQQIAEALSLPPESLVLHTARNAPLVVSLPDGRQLISASLLDHPFGAEAFAVGLLDRARETEALRTLVVQANRWTAYGWFFGAVPTPQDADAALTVSRASTAPTPPATLADHARTHGLPLSPYAAFVLDHDRDDQRAAALAQADWTGGAPTPALLSDQAWVSLQARCASADR